MEDLEQLAEALYGDAAYEVVKSLTPAQKKAQFERRQAQVGLASNVLGLTAGAAALNSATRDFNAARRAKKGLAPKPVKVGRMANVKAKHAVALAGGALALQGANVAGDVVANRVLARASKVQKSDANNKLAEPRKIRLVRIGTGAALELSLIHI